MAQFFTLLTEVGQAKLANAIALGQTIEITQLAVGDGGGSLPEPQGDETQLVNERRRASINTSHVDEDNPTWIVVEQVIPPDVGGWTIREVGIVDSAGDLIAYGNYPETYKPILEEGSSRTQTVRFVLEVSDTAAVTLKVDPSVVLATREYVDDQRAEHESSRDHPAATTEALGFVEKATTAEAKSGAPDKFPDSAAVLASIKQFGIGGGKNTGERLNQLKTPGFYYSAKNDTPTDRPASCDVNGYVIVISHAYDDFSLQVFVPFNANRQFFRREYGGQWQPWAEMFHSGNLDVQALIDTSRKNDQFAIYDPDRIYTTGEIARGSDGVFYEFYDRDQLGEVTDVDPTDPINRPHIWMEWHGVRPGTVIEWRSETLPEGYIENDGSEIGRADYRRVFAVFGETHGAGDGSTTFQLPDDRGEFKRGWDHGRGIDSGRQLSSHQLDAFQDHFHYLPTTTGSGGNSIEGDVNAAFYDQEYPNGAIRDPRAGGAGDNNGVAAGVYLRTYYASSVAPSNWKIASETRPRNNAAIYLTKI